VREVDAGLLKYINLKELTLTGNLIRHINPDHLPRHLEVCQVYCMHKEGYTWWCCCGKLRVQEFEIKIFHGLFVLYSPCSPS